MSLTNSINQGEYPKLMKRLFEAFMKRQDIIGKNIDTNILKALAFVESMIDNVLIAAITSDPEKIVNPPQLLIEILGALQITRKLKILKKFDLVDEDIYKKIIKLNDARISHAHVKSDLDSKSLANFSLKDIQLPLAKSYLKQVNPKAFEVAFLQDELNKISKPSK